MKTIIDYISNLGAGSVVSILVLILSCIEISPIKISPLQWIGRRINAELLEKVEKTEKKLDEHIAESYRNNIFMVQDKLLKGEKLAYEEFTKALKVCGLYEKYIKDNGLTNGEADQAIQFIERRYQVALNSNDFLQIPRN